MMSELFDTLRELKQDVMRNIVQLLSSEKAFADLLDDKNSSTDIADKALARVMTDNNDLFHYTTAIGYPFETDHFMMSRYSDATYPVWYGAMEMMTTIHETAYHMMKRELGIEKIHHVDVIIRERIIYNVYCHGILIDLTRKKKFYTELVSESHNKTQKIGKQIYQQGFPGLLAPSARYPKGINVNIFKHEILSDPRVNCRLTYRMIPTLKKVEVFQRNRKLQEVML